MEEHIDKDETIGGRSIFNESSSPRMIPRVVGMLEEIWPDAGAPIRQTDAAGAMSYVFSGQPGVEMSVETLPSGEAKLFLQIFPAGSFMSVGDFSGVIGELGAHWNWSSKKIDTGLSLQLTRLIHGDDLSPSREVMLRRQISRIKDWTKSLCPPHTGDLDVAALQAKYQKFVDVLTPILPWDAGAGNAREPGAWAAGAADLLMGGVSAGVTAETPLEQSLALSVISSALNQCRGQTLGRVKKMSLNTEQLLHLVFDAPGLVAVPARILRIGVYRYDVSNESINVLSSLAAENRAAVFFGSYGALQNIFSGGQGGEPSPHDPAVCRFPEADLEVLIAFAVEEICRRVSMRNLAFMDEVRREVAECLDPIERSQARRLVHQTAVRVVEGKLHPGMTGDVSEFAQRLLDCSETFGGVCKRPRVRRFEAIQKRYLDRLTDPGLIPYLEDRLLGQDTAIEEVVEKLRRQALTCPIYQPLRVGALGPTGTGKSEFAALLARWLDVPFCNIDAASMSDHHTAMSQMLGSGRGIIDSDQAGRLEQIAKHHEGAVVEVSDIDHAVPSVRGPITDIFLQVLQTGEAQAAKGHMFNCSNVIFVFTLNLPGGRDERIFQPMGFAKAPELEEVRKDARRELKQLFSAAFWGRVGDPVLFGPLGEDVRTEIVRRVLQEASILALGRLNIHHAHVDASTETARRFLSATGAPAASLGARGLQELAQQHAARAVMHFTRDGIAGSLPALELVVNEGGHALLQEVSANERSTL
ncbi:MAG TPA: AAA family ATPase [Candidatus Hydrogenedentes bacterium]|nr:AAA family ATPase [Candidatus Hydrogenedentota bacterium]